MRGPGRGRAHGKGEVSFGFDLDDIFAVLDPAAWRALSFAKFPMLLVKATGMVLFLWIFIATSIKRLHDRDKSGWWAVPFVILPGLLDGAATATLSTSGATVVSVLSSILLLWGFVELGLLRGTPGTNRFGPSPLQNG